ncbi:cytochrome P450 [Desarmillaria tabescens]|uniref:Cytochrome P450 n=1 Tax=Armillaria tabescens TaxID=1929756 RepID=A0AA39NFK9_ARMTA|nr:cytochrome P450 [Desarmillaria tabescens]KAK0464724.1 cytochrome P450 [Desarmillaria tabescens]
MFLLFLFLLLLFYLCSNFFRLLARQWRSPLLRLPGPPSQSFFAGNLEQMHDMANSDLLSQWEAQYGPNYAYRGFLNGSRLMTTDPVALSYILGHAYDYPKPDFVRDSLAAMGAGHEGLLTSEGEVHKRQRKILSPAFSLSHIKSLTPIFWDKAEQLRDIWLQSPGKPVRVDALSYLARATLDVIGLAGFGYHFDSLSSCDNTNELAHAFSVIFSTARKFRLMTILQVWFPILRRFRRHNATMTAAHATMRRIGLELIQERRQAVTNEMREKKPMLLDGNKTILGRDILSVLIRSNLSASSSEQMSLPEILSQISTFLAAGHETSASALTWCLYALVTNPDTQAVLRGELRQLEALEGDRERLTDEIMKCQYLDWVVRETLRLHSPVTNTMRVCMRDEDEIPIDCSSTSTAPGGYVDKHGVRRYTIKVKKWDIITIPIQAINDSERLWGEDSKVFRPERWAARSPLRANSIPGLYSNIMTFLNGNPIDGNRSCIGYKFALLEIKIFLYVLLKDLEFSIDPTMVIEKRVNVVTRPFVKSEPQLGNQLPLFVHRVSRGDVKTDVVIAQTAQ